MSQFQIFENIPDKKWFKEDNGEIWFHASWIAAELGFANTTVAVKTHTDEDERKQIDIGVINPAWFVSEAGVWGMILASKTEQAKTFKRQLKHEILPKLRSQGYYATPEIDAVFQDIVRGMKSDHTARCKWYVKLQRAIWSYRNNGERKSDLPELLKVFDNFAGMGDLEFNQCSADRNLVKLKAVLKIDLSENDKEQCRFSEFDNISSVKRGKSWQYFKEYDEPMIP